MIAEIIDPAILGFILIGVMLFAIFIGFPISFTLIFLGFVFGYIYCFIFLFNCFSLYDYWLCSGINNERRKRNVYCVDALYVAY